MGINRGGYILYTPQSSKKKSLLISFCSSASKPDVRPVRPDGGWGGHVESLRSLRRGEVKSGRRHVRVVLQQKVGRFYPQGYLVCVLHVRVFW